MDKTEKHPLRILILGDNAEKADAYLRLLAGNDHSEKKLASMHQGRQALIQCAATTYSGFLLEHELPEMSGLEFIRRLNDTSALLQAPVVIITGFDRFSEKSLAIRLSNLQRGDKSSDTTRAVRGAVREALREQSFDVEPVRASQLAGTIAHHDPVTRLGNRKLFDLRCGQSILVAERNGQQLCVAVIDLDGYDDIVASLGQDQADTALRVLAKRLQATSRKADTLVRAGHSSFALLAESGVTRTGVVALAEKLVRVSDQSIELSGAVVSVAFNVGLAIYPDHGDSVDALLRAASAAMIDARSRSDRCALYSPGIATRQRRLSQVV